MPRDKTAPVGIIGSGCWGLSTAYHLVKQGYSNVTIFDRASEAPSPFSAANDLNKIVRAQYDDEFYTELGLVRVLPSLVHRPTRTLSLRSKLLPAGKPKTGRRTIIRQATSSPSPVMLLKKPSPATTLPRTL